jgi:hypothetical protein
LKITLSIIIIATLSIIIIASQDKNIA